MAMTFDHERDIRSEWRAQYRLLRLKRRSRGRHEGSPSALLGALGIGLAFWALAFHWAGLF
jgi:hypothetical protein